MNSGQVGSFIFRVVRDTAGQWVVREDGFDMPHAAFNEQADAVVYADDMAKAMAGSRVKVFNEAGREIFA